MRLHIAVLFLLFAAVAWGADAVPARSIRSVSVGAVQIEPALIMPLAGANEALVRERLADEVRSAGVRLGNGHAIQDDAYFEAVIDGAFVAQNSVAYRVDIALKQRPIGTGAKISMPKTVGQRSVTGTVSAAGLSIQVLVALEELAADLLREHAAATRSS